MHPDSLDQRHERPAIPRQPLFHRSLRVRPSDLLALSEKLHPLAPQLGCLRVQTQLACQNWGQ